MPRVRDRGIQFSDTDGLSIRISRRHGDGHAHLCAVTNRCIACIDATVRFQVNDDQDQGEAAMRINKFCSLIGLSTVLLLGPLTAAQAQKPGLYVGAGVGAYSIDESDLSENDHVIKAYVGGQFTNL